MFSFAAVAKLLWEKVGKKIVYVRNKGKQQTIEELEKKNDEPDIKK